MKASDIFHLICRSLILNEHPELRQEIQNQLNDSKDNLERFIHMASNHLVLPTIYLNFERMDMLSVFPVDLSEHLKDIYQLNVQRNQQILNQIEEINGALLKKNIQPVYLKGCANLMDELYSDPGERLIGDIDFLFLQNDYKNAIDICKNLGYYTNIIQYKNEFSWNHYPRLFKFDVPADVEIHNTPVEFRYAKKFETERLFENKINPTAYPEVALPSIENRLIHNFIHSQLSNKGHACKTIGIRDIYDAWLLMGRLRDVDQVIDQIEEQDKARIFFDYIGYLFRPQQNLNRIKNKATIKFIKKHEWFLNHPRLNILYYRSIKLHELIYMRYFLRITHSLMNKKDRTYILNRIKDPKWYKQHLKGVIELFK